MNANDGSAATRISAVGRGADVNLCQCFNIDAQARTRTRQQAHRISICTGINFLIQLSGNIQRRGINSDALTNIGHSGLIASDIALRAHCRH